ncbi:unnamed protein product [Vicia faba]|uniref:ADP-ribosyl cyclase/cyclic ADP-ribose hydrolase n=1 Tax=Vicia faba TaxID=3906 RepID=A0AAV1B7F2_VICFA|nr:unnamed protein product [Vicia faba]
MACTSNSSSSSLVKSPKKNYYDVFVSFRGKDTRYNLADHLFAAFQRKGILAFRDDTKLKKGYGVDIVYKVPLLSQLAFKILHYANGLPLAVKVLGSLSFEGKEC